MVLGSGLCWSESLVGVFGVWWGLRGFFGRFLPSLCGLRVGIFGSLIGGLSFSIDLSCLFGAMGGLRCVLGAQEF